MKKTTTLMLLACLFCTAGSFGQLATKVSSSFHYGKLFTDETVLYEIKSDTLFSLDNSTGSRTFLYKLPAPPAGNFVVKWGTSISVKTPAGFMLDQQLQDIDHGYTETTRIWTNTGSGWDTITVGTQSVVYGSPLLLGSKYSMIVVTTGNVQQLLRTDFTKAGTNIVMTSSTGITTGDFRRGTDRVFFSTLGNGTTVNAKEYMMDDASLQAIDSGNITCRTLGAIGNEVYYERRQASTTSSDLTIRKWSVAAGTWSVLIGGISVLTDFNDGTSFNGHIVVAKTDSGKHAQALVSIDPATGTQMYLTTVISPAANFPIYYFKYSSPGSAHMYIYGADSPGVNFNIVTDGATASGTQKVEGANLFFTYGAKIDPSQSAICGDDAYGKLGIVAGNQQLYRIDATGAVAHQDLNSATGLGSDPDNFLHVGSNIFFTAWGSGSGTTPNYINDLWEITGCSSVNSVASIAPLAPATLLYPNPASGEVVVALENNIANATIELYDALGRKVLSTILQNGSSFSVSQMINGIYYYRISANGSKLQAGRLSVMH